MRDLIVDRDNPWVTLYDPAWKTLPAADTFARQNPKVAGEYARWLMPGEVSQVEEIKPGMGAVIHRGSSKVAVSRDDKGSLHACSAVCSHLDCIVSWNSTEDTWDYLSRLAVYSGREIAEWTCAWSFKKGFIILGQITFAGESNRVAVADFVLIASFDRSDNG